MKLFEFLHGMSNVRRWSHAYCHKEEFILEHTAVVAIIALKIGKDLGADMGSLLTKALVHDMEEVITGDVPTPTKYSNATITKEFRKLERLAAHEVATAFGEWAFNDWAASKDHTIEGQIIRLADCAAVVFKINQELILGNRYFKQFTENCWAALEQQRMDKLTPQPLLKYIEDFKEVLLTGDIEVLYEDA